MGCLWELCKKKKQSLQSIEIPPSIQDDEEKGKDNEKKKKCSLNQFPIQSNINWDDYFTQEQLEYYKYLYQNESFDTNTSNDSFISHGKFRKGELIGEGSYGRVYQGFNEENGGIIAIKEIDIEHLSNKSQNISNTVQTEIEVLSRLNHKNIIKYLGTYTKKNKLNIVIEYCIGGSLFKLLEVYHNFRENIVRKWTVQILEGIEYLHSHNIMHLDIKCANILVGRDGVCKLSDFGGAKIIKGAYAPSNNSIEGTPNWMAPEIVKKGEATRFSDIWSIGCTVIEMFQGKPPWSDHYTAISVLNCIYKAREPPPIPENASPELKDFLKKCLQIEPKKRWNVYCLLRHPFINKNLHNYIPFNCNVSERKPLLQNDVYFDKNTIYAPTNFNLKKNCINLTKRKNTKTRGGKYKYENYTKNASRKAKYDDSSEYSIKSSERENQI